MSGQAVCGFFNSRASAANALEELKEARFNHSEIKVLFAPPAVAKVNVESNKMDYSFAVLGVISGGVFGGLVGFLTGLVLGSEYALGLTSSSLEAPIILTLAGIGIGGALGALTAALLDINAPESNNAGNGRPRTGDFLIVADAQSVNQVDKASEILRKNDAQKVSVTTI